MQVWIFGPGGLSYKMRHVTESSEWLERVYELLEIYQDNKNLELCLRA